ncbi:hypothetical protein KP509_24G025100 [Ceratopteris richardii]|uniref:histidine kinase n=2 Tax=Ceratopteris richardii TaxID=49495 RepID=A0A8T2RW43_CERRI|nr:hypothetical protein KP509_24G025100 [Ceratopteris richardii]
MDSSPLYAPEDPILRARDVPTKQSKCDVVAASKMLGKKIFCSIPEGHTVTEQQRNLPADEGSADQAYKEAAPGKRYLKPSFRSRLYLDAPLAFVPNESLLDEGFLLATQRQLRASIIKQGLTAAVSTFLTVAFCVIAVVTHLPRPISNDFEGAPCRHLEYYWAMTLNGLSAAFLCLLSLTCFVGFMPKRDCDCGRHNELQKISCRIHEAEERARHVVTAKQQFLTYVFHNIRIPFNAIVLGLGYLRSKEHRVPAEADIIENANLIQMMVDCAETMTNILDDVTDMGNWEDGVMQLRTEEFDLFGVLKFILWGLKDLLYEKHINFTIKMDSTTKGVLKSDHVLGDKHRVLQTLGNFLSNAVKLSPEEGKLELTIKCEEVYKNGEYYNYSSKANPGNAQSEQAEEILPRLRMEGLNRQGSRSSKSYQGSSCDASPSFAKVYIAVNDIDNGITSQDLEKLFEPYAFISSEWEDVAGGSDLGLNTAKQFVEHSGGCIGVKSKEGEGREFYLCLPFPLKSTIHAVEFKDDWLDSFMAKDVQTKDPPISGQQEKLGTESGTSCNSTPTDKSCRKARSTSDLVPADKQCRKILLVEDTKVNRVILRKVLQTLNLRCEEAENGQVAVNLIKEGRMYDLILMDKEMPVMDGHEATRQIRLLGVLTPIVALTGNALKSDKKLFLEAGVNDFHTKPLTREKLMQVLARFEVYVPDR